LLCLRVTTVNPVLVTSDNPGQEGCIFGGDLTKLLADIDTLLLLISCQNPGHKFGGNTMHAQFSSQNPSACPTTNSDLIHKVLNDSTSILTNKLLKFGKSVGCCAADGPNTRVRPMLSSLNACLIIARVSITLFSEICKKFDAHSLFLCRIHSKIASGRIHDSK
jgi:hypothetical protein